MGADEGDVYMLRPDEDASEDDADAWISPRPASEVILDAVRAEVDGDGDFDDLDAYVDLDSLAALLDGGADGDEMTFDVDGHRVTVHRSGDVDVAPDDG